MRTGDGDCLIFPSEKNKRCQSRLPVEGMGLSGIPSLSPEKTSARLPLGCSLSPGQKSCSQVLTERGALLETGSSILLCFWDGNVAAQEDLSLLGLPLLKHT